MILLASLRADLVDRIVTERHALRTYTKRPRETSFPMPRAPARAGEGRVFAARGVCFGGVFLRE